MVERGRVGRRGIAEYFRALLPERRRHPRADLLSSLIAAEEQGDRLTEGELLATCVLLFIAGHETTVNLIGNGLLALLRHPAELERLRAQPALLGSAVEELLRFDGPVQRTARITNAEVEVGGRTLPAGAFGGDRHRRGQPGSARSSPSPTGWTSAGARTATSPSGSGSTSAWARRWPAWRASSPWAR